MTQDSSSAARRDQGSGFGEFFRYHGWLAPGVRLFRSIDFKAKAAWVSVAFVAPLVILLGILWNSAAEQLASTRAEIDGVAYTRSLLALLDAAQERRSDAMQGDAQLPAQQDRVAAAFGRVQTMQRQHGQAFDTAAPFTALEQAHQGLMSQAVLATPDATFLAHDEMIDRLLELLRQVADGSQLSLDPALQTYHMMNLAVLRGPMQLENTARLIGMGRLMLRSGERTRERHDLIVRWSAVWTYIDRDIENSFIQGIGNFPEVAKAFDMKGTDEASDAFKEAIRSQLLSGAEGPAPVDGYLGLGRQALKRQADLNSQVLQRLDEQLALRIGEIQRTFFYELAVALAFVWCALYLFLSFYKVMRGGLQEVAGHLGEVAQGNLATSPRPWGSDEAAELMNQLAAMQESLRRTVGVVLSSASGVHGASQEIAAASRDLSQRTEQTAASLEQTSSSMEQISESVKRSASTVEAATDSVKDNARAAEHGGKAIAEVVTTMEGIRGSSNKIGEIIGVIDSIAFQTNILALNAAVEAARAGEHGRGFAVVASEVRALAGRSATAAREIKTLINTSIEQVEGGSAVVARAGDIMQTVVANADRIATLMGEISASTREQNKAISEVGQAVAELDRATQQNAALVEQTTAASSAMADQASRLSSEVSVFRLP